MAKPGWESCRNRAKFNLFGKWREQYKNGITILVGLRPIHASTRREINQEQNREREAKGNKHLIIML